MNKKTLIAFVSVSSLALALGICILFLLVPKSRHSYSYPINQSSLRFPQTVISKAFLKDTVDMPDRLYTVDRVIDGDTIEVSVGGSEKVPVRLLGINAPETVDPRKQPQCYGKEASDKTKELLTAKAQVKIHIDSVKGPTEKYGRLLAYVTRASDGLLINKYLIENGFAREYTYENAYGFQSEFRAAEQAAKESNLGLWNPKNCPNSNYRAFKNR